MEFSGITESELRKRVSDIHGEVDKLCQERWQIQQELRYRDNQEGIPKET